MRNIIKVIATVILTVLIFSTNLQAKSVIKRVAPEDTSRSTIAMALETYDGSFYDVTDLRRIRSKKGNAQKIMRKGVIKTTSGEDIDANSIRFFFVRSRTFENAGMPLKGDGSIFKSPSEDE